MKIHADTLTLNQLHDAVPNGCYIAQEEEVGSRKRDHAFEVRLSGSSKYGLGYECAGHKAATWDEWGIFINSIFEVEPTAICGMYDGRNDFIDKTQAEYERISTYRQDLLPTHSAPWLN